VREGGRVSFFREKKRKKKVRSIVIGMKKHQEGRGRWLPLGEGKKCYAALEGKRSWKKEKPYAPERREREIKKDLRPQKGKFRAKQREKEAEEKRYRGPGKKRRGRRGAGRRGEKRRGLREEGGVANDSFEKRRLSYQGKKERC